MTKITTEEKELWTSLTDFPTTNIVVAVLVLALNVVLPGIELNKV